MQSKQNRAAVRFRSETTANGVSERLFTLDDIPGVLWSPADVPGPRPLVLLGHGAMAVL